MGTIFYPLHFILRNMIYTFLLQLHYTIPDLNVSLLLNIYAVAFFWPLPLHVNFYGLWHEMAYIKNLYLNFCSLYVVREVGYGPAYLDLFFSQCAQSRQKIYCTIRVYWCEKPLLLLSCAVPNSHCNKMHAFATSWKKGI